MWRGLSALALWSVMGAAHATGDPFGWHYSPSTHITPDNVGTLDEGFLTQVLLYHVVNGRRDSNDVLSSTQLRTLQRGFLQQASGVLTDNLGRTANIGAGVGAVDVSASNGIIHAIDAVVLPYAP